MELGEQGIRLRLNANGRVVIPAAVRKALGVEAGDELILEKRDDVYLLTTQQQRIQQAQKRARARIRAGAALADAGGAGGAGEGAATGAAETTGAGEVLSLTLLPQRQPSLSFQRTIGRSPRTHASLHAAM